MSGGGTISVFEAVEWREHAPGGGSQAQVFRLADGRFAIVKFPENSQGELVLANEFLCCQLAELLDLPINRAVIVSIDERLLRLPRQQGHIPAAFSAGLRCGMIRFETAEGVQAVDIPAQCDNSDELHAVAVFDDLVSRADGRQLLMYPSSGPKGKTFAAYDYGYAFGGQPRWTAATLGSIAPVTLPPRDPFAGQPYQDGSNLAPMIGKRRTLARDQVRGGLMALQPPRWETTLSDIDALAPVLLDRALALVGQFDNLYPTLTPPRNS